MKKILLAVTLLCLLFSSHCNKQKGKEILLEEKNVSLPILQGKSKSLLIQELAYPSLYSDGSYLYLYGTGTQDNVPAHILVRKLDTQLNTLEDKTFPFGSGPGDLTDYAAIFPFDTGVYATDLSQGRIHIFDTHFTFKESKVLREYNTALIMINNGHHVIGTNRTFSQDGKFVTYTDTLISFPQMHRIPIHTIGPIAMYYPPKKRMMGENPEYFYFYHPHKQVGQLYFVNMKTYQLRIYSLEGKIIKAARLDVTPQKVPADMRKIWISEQTHNKNTNAYHLTHWIHPGAKVVPLQKGFVVIRRHSYSTHCTGLQEGDYFDYDLHHLGKMQFPCFYFLNKLVAGLYCSQVTYCNGHLFLINETDEDFTLEKWQLQE